MKKQTQTIVVKIQETSRRTIEFDCEIEVPFEVYNDKDALNDFLEDAVSVSKKVNFVGIVDSEQLETEIIDFKEGKLPNETLDRYAIFI